MHCNRALARRQVAAELLLPRRPPVSIISCELASKLYLAGSPWPKTLAGGRLLLSALAAAPVAAAAAVIVLASRTLAFDAVAAGNGAQNLANFLFWLADNSIAFGEKLR